MFKAVHRIIEYMGKDKKRIYIGVVFSLLESIMAVVPLGIVAMMLYGIYQDVNGIGSIEKSAPWEAFGIILGAVILRIFFHYIKSILQDNAAYNMSEEQRINVGEKIKRVALGFFTKTKTGKINAVITTELSFYEMCAMNVVDTIFNSYIFLIVMIIGFFMIAPILGVVVLGSLLLSMLGLYLMTKVSNSCAPNRQESFLWEEKIFAPYPWTPYYNISLWFFRMYISSKIPLRIIFALVNQRPLEKK